MKSHGALEIFLDLLNLHPELSRSEPLIQARTGTGWKVITRTVATKALRRMLSNLGGDPTQHALPSGRIGGATQLAAQGSSGRGGSLVFMVYVRAGGEGVDFVAEALTR